MSKKGSKLGRSTKKISEKSREIIKSCQMRFEKVPYLLNQSSSQDLIISFSNKYSELIDLNLKKTIRNFDKMFQDSYNMLQQGTFDKNDYMEVLHVAGCEIDNRKLFLKLMDSVIAGAIMHQMNVLKRFPGLDSLTDEKFFRLIGQRKRELEYLSHMSRAFEWKNDSFLILFDENHKLEIKKKDFGNILDRSIAEREHELFKWTQKVNVTFEEGLFIVMLKFLEPSRGYEQFREFHNRLAAAFIRYLENRYSKNYHLRFLELMNLVSRIHTHYNSSDKWVERNYDYLQRAHPNQEALDHLWVPKDISKTYQHVNKLKYLIK